MTSATAASPDGRLIAYDSDESAREEIYVVPFPPTGAKYQVSSKGGSRAIWRSDGPEIFFLDSENLLTAVPAQVTGEVPRFGAPQPLFQIYGSVGPAVRWDVAPGGQRLLVSEDVVEANAAPVVLVTDWVKTLGK